MAVPADYTAVAEQLYIAYFGRPADRSGLINMTTNLAASGAPVDIAEFAAAYNTNGTVKAILDNFGNSAESQAQYPGTDSQFITAIFQNVLGRDPLLAGLDFWTAALANKEMTRAQAASQIMAAGLGNETDALTIANKTTVATAFTAGIDTAAEVNAYSGAAAAKLANEMLDKVNNTTDTIAFNATVTEALSAIVTLNTPVVTAGLTTGIDNISTGAGNDIINAPILTGADSFTSLDNIDGGNGNDTLNLVTGGTIAASGAIVRNVETVNVITSAASLSGLDTSSWTGLNTLNITAKTAIAATAATTTDVNLTNSAATGATTITGGKAVTVTETAASAGTLNITGAAGAVAVTSTTAAANGTTGNAITVSGGTTVNVTQIAGNSAGAGVTTTAGAVSVTGGAATTAVTVKDTAAGTAAATVVGHVNGAVTIADSNAGSGTAAGTISSVTLENFAAASIDSSALTTLNLAGNGTSVSVGRGALTATPTANTLTVNLSGLTLTGALTDAEAAGDDGFTTVNVVANTAASSVGSLAVADATTLNISGSAAFTSGGETLTSVTAINVTNSASTTLTTILGNGVTFTGGAGNETITIGATTKAITLGAGNDVVTATGLVGTGGSVDGGAGTDTIALTFAQADAADVDATFNTKFTGFEILSVSGGTGALDLAGLNNVRQVVATGATNGLILNSMANGGSLTLADGSTAATVNVLNAAFSATDSLTVALSNSTGGVAAFGTVTVAGVETINVSTVDVGTGANVAATQDTLGLVAAAATRVNVTGNNGVDLTTGSTLTAVTTFDASGVVGNTSADTGANLGVKFTSTNTTAAVSITGGAGNDVLTASAGSNVHTITGGNGADTITGGAGNDIINLTETTAAADTVVFLTAASNGIDTITGFAAGAGADLVQLVAGATTNAAQTTAGIADFAASTNTTLNIGAAAFALTGGNTTTDDVIEINATLSSFGNLGAAGVVDGTELLKGLSSVNVAAGGLATDTAGDDFYVVAYQNGNAYLYQVTNGADTVATAAEIALVGVFNGVAAGAFAAGDFTV
nr:DUF4214 domain-containing protein [uncultured Duganella sp.]